MCDFLDLEEVVKPSIFLFKSFRNIGFFLKIKQFEIFSTNQIKLKNMNKFYLNHA